VSWRLNNVGRAKFLIPYTDAACTRDNLAPGNRVWITFDALPDWGGVLDLPRRRTGTGVRVVAYSGEWIFGWRRTSKSRTFTRQAPGVIARTLLEEVNAVWATGITPGSIYIGGTARTLEYHYHDLLARLRDLQRLTGHDFAVIPALNGGALTFSFNWYQRRGVDRSSSVLLTEGGNVDVGANLDEQGPLYNRVITVGEGSTWSDARLDGIESDANSRIAYDYRENAYVQSGVQEQATLDANAAELLKTLKAPRARVTMTALDRDPAGFERYDVGDTVAVELFQRYPEWAYNATVRVIAREWTPNGVCRLEVEEE
jgi:hypothetical protein